MRPTRDTAAGRAYLDLQAKARAEKQPTDSVLVLYALEGFLARLTASDYRDQLVLKGGVLLAAFLVRRPTRDVDLQAQELPNDLNSVLALVRAIASGAPTDGVDDGLVFHADRATGRAIRDEDAYSGVRVSLTATLHTARISFHVDVNVGDPIWPVPQTVQLPRLLGGSLELRGYPVAMVYAEKIVTALDRGIANTRWRDFGDVYVLSVTQTVTALDLIEAISAVAQHREVKPQPLHLVLDGYALIAQPRYTAWRRRHQRLELPHDFADLLAEVAAFVDPVLDGSTTDAMWSPSQRTWT